LLQARRLPIFPRMFAFCRCCDDSTNEGTQEMTLPTIQPVPVLSQNYGNKENVNKGQKPVADRVTLQFSTADGPVQKDLTERPLGMKFAGKGPLKVTSIHEKYHAAEIGVQLNWIVTHIDGESLEGKSDEEVRNTLKVKTSKLRLFPPKEGSTN